MQSIFRIISKIIGYNSILTLAKNYIATLVSQFCNFDKTMCNFCLYCLATLVRLHFFVLAPPICFFEYSVRNGDDTLYARI